MKRNDAGAIDRIFSSREELIGGFKNFPETDAALLAFRDYLTRDCLDSHAQLIKAEDYLLDVTAAYERQGFSYGFRYAVRLLMDALAAD